MKKTTLINLIGVGFIIAMFLVIACKKTTDRQQITTPVEQENILAVNGISDAISKMGSYNDSLIKASSHHDKLKFYSMYHHHDSLYIHHHSVYHHGDTTHHHPAGLHKENHHHIHDSITTVHHKFLH